VKSLSEKLPRRVLVSRVISYRYDDRRRPLSWDKRHAGLESIETAEGEIINLLSNGGQSTPKPGWELLLIKNAEQADFENQLVEWNESSAVTWTLYGIKAEAAVSGQSD